MRITCEHRNQMAQRGQWPVQRVGADTLFHQKTNVSTLAGYFEGAVTGAK